MGLAQNHGTLQFPDAEGTASGIGMVRAAHAGHEQLSQFMEQPGHSLHLLLVEAEHHVDAFFFQQIGHGLKGYQLYGRVEGGKLLYQLFYDRRQYVQFRLIMAANGKKQGIIKTRPQPVFRAGGDFYYAGSILHKHKTSFGQGYIFAGAYKKPGAQLILQGCDLMAYRRLCDFQGFCGPGKIQVFCHGKETF